MTESSFTSRRDLLLALAGAGTLTAFGAEARTRRRHHAAGKKVAGASTAPAFDDILQDLHKRTFTYFWGDHQSW